jgi:hypothetical protein
MYENPAEAALKIVGAEKLPERDGPDGYSEKYGRYVRALDGVYGMH